jgi:hypothetical protein
LYPLLLAGAIGTLAWTSHEGGSLTHGSHFLTERLPARVQAWFGLGGRDSAAARSTGAASAPVRSPAARPARLSPSIRPGGDRSHGPAPGYAAAISPLLDRSCVSCHRPDKHKGGLRLDAYAQLMAAASEIVRRITLPPDDDDYMPSDGKKPLSAAEIQVIQDWIAGGAAGP